MRGESLHILGVRPCLELFDALADLLVYPEPGLRTRIEHCREHLLRVVPGGGSLLDRYAEIMESRPLSEIEESYISTFDLNPACTLDLGWHLFGEDYNRGRYLVRLRRELRRCGVAEREELPDHLTLALRLLARMQPAEGAEFASCCVGPALEKIMNSLPGDNPYHALLETVKAAIDTVFGPVAEESKHGATA